MNTAYIPSEVLNMSISLLDGETVLLSKFIKETTNDTIIAVDYNIVNGCLISFAFCTENKQYKLVNTVQGCFFL